VLGAIAVPSADDAVGRQRGCSWCRLGCGPAYFVVREVSEKEKEEGGRKGKGGDERGMGSGLRLIASRTTVTPSRLTSLMPMAEAEVMGRRL